MHEFIIAKLLELLIQRTAALPVHIFVHNNVTFDFKLSTILCKSQAVGCSSFFAILTCMPQMHSIHTGNNPKSISNYSEASMTYIFV